MVVSLDDLLAEVVANLDSDEPRLVLADALQAAGDPRGDLIVVQCELARLGADRTTLASGRRDWLNDALARGDRSRIAELRKLERSLLAHGPLLPWRPDLYNVERGFVSHLDAGPSGGVSQFFDKAPAIESLALELALPGDYLFSEPRLLQLRQLRLQFMPREVDRVPSHDFLDTLEHLRHYALSGFETADADPPDVERVLPPAMRPKLEGMEVSSNVLGRLPLDELSRVRHLAVTHDRHIHLPEAFASRLEIVELQHGESLPTLGPSLRTLCALRISPLGFDVERLRGHQTRELPRLNPAVALAIGSQLPTVRLLALTALAPGPWISSMFCSGGLDQLAEVRFEHCLLEATAVSALALSPVFHRIERLVVSSSFLTEESFDWLATLDQLKVLDLGWNSFDDDWVPRLRLALPSTEVRARE